MFDQPETTRSRNRLAEALTWGGMLLLLAGGLLMGLRLAPFVSSRLRPVEVQPLPSNAPTNPTSIPIPSPSPTAIESEEGGSTSAEVAPPGETETVTPTIAIPTATPIPRTPTRIVIPSIELDASVVTTTLETAPGTEGEELSVWAVPALRAAGWHETSAPLGVPGNTVLNGHNTTRGEVFRDLYQAEPGDRMVIYSEDMPFVYEISEKLFLPEGGQPLEVRVANARYIQPTSDERITLVTCHPYASLQYRLIVIAYPEEEASTGAVEE